MRRSTVILLMTALAITLISEKVMANGAKTASERVIIGMATDANGLGDGSFNDGVYAGLKKVEDESRRQLPYLH